MRKKLRPDVASDTSRRNNNCVTTQHQIRRDENEGTNSHDDNIWQFPALFRELPYVFYAEYQSFTHIIWQLNQRIQTFFYFFFTSLMTYPDQRHHTASIPITKINIYVAILPMKILPL